MEHLYHELFGISKFFLNISNFSLAIHYLQYLAKYLSEKNYLFVY